MRRIFVTSVLATASLAIAACGGSSNDDEPGSASATGAGGSAFAEQNKAAVDRYLSEQGTFVPPPKSAPKPQPGKHIALISCGSTVIPSCGIEINAAKEAAESMGWKTTVVDAAGGDPTTTVPGIQSAIAKGVDGIFTYYIDCQYISRPLEAAKKAGIPVINSNGRDCSEADPGSPSLFTSSIRYNAGDGSFTDWVNEVSIAQARYAVEKLGGQAQIGFFTDSTSAAGKAAATAVTEALDECEGCEVEGVFFPISDIGSKLQGKTESFLLKNPKVNSVIPAYNAVLLGGMMAGVQNAGREILVSVAEGLKEGVALVRDGKAQYGYGLSYGWEAYAAIDSLNRVFNKQNPDVNSGIGVQIFDKEHNFPTGDTWEPPYDYRALYRKAWGVAN